MVLQEEADELIKKFIALKNKAYETNTKQDKKIFNEHKSLCIKKFMYLIEGKTAKYIKYNNYADLNQDGVEALLRAMENYDPEKGNFFWWSHRYIETKLCRSANLHSVIRYPFKGKKAEEPRRVRMPILLDYNSAEKKFEKAELNLFVKDMMHLLDDEQKNIINLYYGFNRESLSVNKICSKLHITKPYFKQVLNNAIYRIRRNIKF